MRGVGHCNPIEHGRKGSAIQYQGRGGGGMFFS